MKTIVYSEYGTPEVLKVAEAAKPAPKENEILVRNLASTVTYGDLTARNFKNVTLREFNMPALLAIFAKISFGLRKPKQPVLGSEFSGVVEAGSWRGRRAARKQLKKLASLRRRLGSSCTPTKAGSN